MILIYEKNMGHRADLRFKRDDEELLRQTKTLNNYSLIIIEKIK